MKTPVLEFLLLFCEICKSLKNIYFEEHLQTTASGNIK